MVAEVEALSNRAPHDIDDVPDLLVILLDAFCFASWFTPWNIALCI
jgi:hypothetical protein